MLTLPPKFKQALGNGVRTSLYPLVRIYKGYQIDDTIPDDVEAINLSIKETSIKNLNDTYEGYIPLLLNSPSISSKADIINNKYTISSVSLSISNAPYNGKIFSDDIPSLLNAVVQVYYAANGLNTLEDCLLVYTGTIRRYSQSAETLSLTLEDLTEQKLKTQIPATLIEDEDLYTDEQIGQPYPMVYGYVDKSPLVLDKNDSLSIDKPNINIMGIWHNISNVSFQNTSIVDTHPIMTGGWLTRKSFLYTYNDGYLPIMEKMPHHFGSRTYEFEEETMYEFEENSSKININSNNFIYEIYTEDDEDEDEDEVNIVGTGKLGIPTRIYRPVKNINFFANNHGVQEGRYSGVDYYRASSCNKFYGYTGLDNHSVTKTVNVLSEDDADINNSETPADDLYQENWETGDKTWWKTTDLNNESGTENVDGIFDNVDANYQFEGKDPYFPVERIQNNSTQSGLHLNAQNANDLKTGAYARLELNEDVPSYPCVTKILYNIDYFTPDNIDTYDTGNYQFLAAEPSAFWIERNLINRKRNKNHYFESMITTVNDWHEYYDKENWTTACEVPNHEHQPFYSDGTTQFRYTTEGNYGYNDYDNIILGFNDTNGYNSIQWGVPSLRGSMFAISSCIANLKEFYTLQDVLVVEYAKENFYSSIRGRADESGFSVEATDISHNNSGGDYVSTLIWTDEPHHLKAYDKFNFYSGGSYIGEFTCTESNLPTSLLVEDEDIVGYNSGTISPIFVLSKPHTILQNILTEELSYGKGVILPDSSIEDDWINSFSMNEQEEAKSVIENLFKSSIYIPSFDSSGNFKFIDIKQNIEDYNQFEAIDNQDILKYSFGLTKLEDVKNQVNVKYKKDYGSGDFSEETTYGIEDNSGNFVETLDELIEQLNITGMVYDIGYYGMKDEDAKLEVESAYIRDKDTARKLQRRLLMWYANQHLTMKLDLPASYIHLEAGDYIRFDELIGGKLAFGFDYTQEFVKNGQLIYPVFFVTKVAKSLSKVSLELVQVHRGDFGRNDGDLGNYEIPNPYDNDIYAQQPEDYEEDEEEQEQEPYFTAYWDSGFDIPDLHQDDINAIVDTNIETGITIDVQLMHSNRTFNFGEYEITEGINDIEANGLVDAIILTTGSDYGDNATISALMNRYNITKTDQSEPDFDDVDIELEFDFIIKSDTNDDYEYALYFKQVIPPVDDILGDINGDGDINILDIVILVHMILDDAEYDIRADINQDNGLNVLDIVGLINLILGI